MSREERGANKSENENVELIRSKMESLRLEIESMISSDESTSSTEEKLSQMKEFYSDISYALPGYYLRIFKEQISGLEARLNKGGVQKPKFAFKSKITSVPRPQETTPQDKKSETVVREVKRNQKVSMSADQLGKSLTLEDYEDSEITLSGTIETLYLRNLKNCEVNCCVVVSSLFVHQVEDCRIRAVAQQIRVHFATKCRFSVYVLSGMIIEDSHAIEVQALDGDALNNTGDWKSLVGNSPNNWNDVKDFHWIKPTPSPNITYIN